MLISDYLPAVTVPVTAGEGPGRGVGTAFFVGPGLLLTCAHVVADGRGEQSSPVRVSWRGIDRPAQVTAWLPAPGPDLALLTVGVTDHPWAVLDDAAVTGDQLVAYGYPEERRAGDVATFELEGRPAYEGALLKVKAGQAQPGISGAPLLNLRTGGVCGVLRISRDRHSDLGARAVAGPDIRRTLPAAWQVNDALRWVNEDWLGCLDHAQLTELGLGIRSARAREFLAALRGASEALPYRLVSEGTVPPLTTIYIEQQQELQPAAGSVPVAGPSSAGPGTGTSETPAPTGGTILHTPDEALARYQNVLVEGGPGAGKSTLAGYLTARCAEAWLDGERRPYVAVTVTARSLARSAASFDETLFRQVTEALGVRLATPLPAGLFRREPARDTAWLVIIDALDEVPAAERMTLVATIRDRIRSGQGPWRYVITSRPLREEDRKALIGQQVGHYVLRLFERPQIQAFADTWFAARGADGDSRQFVQRLEESRLLEVATVPLLLTLAALVYEQNREEHLPTTRAGLYRRFVHTMLTGREAQQRTLAALRDEFETLYGPEGAQAAGDIFRLRQRVLEHLALWRQSGARGGAPAQGGLAGEGLRWLRPRVSLPEDADDSWLREQVTLLLTRTGLVIAGLDGSLTFAHHTLREYLAARNLAGSTRPGTSDATELIGRLNADGWREIVLFVLAMWSGAGHDVSALLEHALDVPGGGPVFAGQALAENIGVAAETEELIIGRLTAVAARRLGGGSIEPFAALRALGALGANQLALNGLTSIVTAPGGDPVGRLLAAEALIRAGDRDAAAGALVALAADPSGAPAFVAETAARLDGMGLRTEAIEILVTIAAHPATVPRGVLQVAASLDTLGAPSAGRAVLIEMASQSQAPLIRLRLARELERFGEAGRAAGIYRALLAPGGGAVPDLRVRAAAALGRVGDRAEAIAELTAIVRDPASGWSGLQAAESLTQLDAADEALAAQREALADPETPLWRRARIAAELGELRPDPAAGILLDQVVGASQAPLLTWARAVGGHNRLLTGEITADASSPASLVALTRDSFLDGLYGRGTSERQARRFEQAVNSWRQVLRPPAGSADGRTAQSSLTDGLASGGGSRRTAVPIPQEQVKEDRGRHGAVPGTAALACVGVHVFGEHSPVPELRRVQRTQQPRSQPRACLRSVGRAGLQPGDGAGVWPVTW